MNIGQMLVQLGFTAEPASTGLPCPAVIPSREAVPISSSYGLESAREIEAYIDSRKTIGERATTKRSPGNWF